MERPAFDQQVTFLYTRDLAASAAFYEDVLGLPLALDQGACRIYRTGPGAFLGLCHRADAPDSPAGVIITLVSDEVDAWYAYLAARGVTFTKPPTYNAHYNIYHCFLRDPNGYVLEIQTFHDPAWPAS
jgi:catechol 2,3-dioxygenase-like lactoylglutathione lyase family enzyme